MFFGCELAIKYPAPLPNRIGVVDGRLFLFQTEGVILWCFGWQVEGRVDGRGGGILQLHGYVLEVLLLLDYGVFFVLKQLL